MLERLLHVRSSTSCTTLVFIAKFLVVSLYYGKPSKIVFFSFLFVFVVSHSRVFSLGFYGTKSVNPTSYGGVTTRSEVKVVKVSLMACVCESEHFVPRTLTITADADITGFFFAG